MISRKEFLAQAGVIASGLLVLQVPSCCDETPKEEPEYLHLNGLASTHLYYNDTLVGTDFSFTRLENKGVFIAKKDITFNRVVVFVDGYGTWKKLDYDVRLSEGDTLEVRI